MAITETWIIINIKWFQLININELSLSINININIYIVLNIY